MELVKGYSIKNNTSKGYQIKILLQDIQPEIWRRVVVNSSLSLEKFHMVIQKSVGWENKHLHMFVNKDKSYCLPDEDDPVESISEFLDENRFTLGDLLTKEKQTIEYVYDFGDGWQHTILLEKIIDELPKDPVCLEGEKACPPEDIGGPFGYTEFLEALEDPLHEMYDDYTEWIGGKFDSTSFDLEKVNKLLRKL